VNIIVWILFGALVGWIASLIMSTNAEQGMVKNILIGIGGALVGGWLARLFGLGSVDGFDAVSLLIAIAGAVMIIAILKAAQHHA
jgi:uncharacterized membrane protein YeaQ/YmgE (transglycosylase-associated protein family)